jgi:hypothetical protein
VTALNLDTNVLTTAASPKNEFLHVITESEHVVYEIATLKEHKRTPLTKYFPKLAEHGAVEFAKIKINAVSELKLERICLLQGRKLVSRYENKPINMLMGVARFKGTPLFDIAGEHDVAFVKGGNTLTIKLESQTYKKKISSYHALTAVAMSPTSEGAAVVSDTSGMIHLCHPGAQSKVRSAFSLLS